MKFKVIIPILYHSEIEIEAASATDAFLKIVKESNGSDGPGKVVSLKLSHILYPECVPDQIMWDVKDENGRITSFIDTEGSH